MLAAITVTLLQGTQGKTHTGAFVEGNAVKIRHISEHGHGGTDVRTEGERNGGERGEKYN